MGERVNRVFGTTQVTVDPATLQAAGGKTITIDGLVGVANDILRKTRYEGIPPVEEKADKATNAQLDKLYRRLWEDYKEFSRDYPIVFRWIVYHQVFDEKAFKAYMKTNHKPMWKNREEMLKEQGEYLVYLWRIKNRKEGTKRLQEYRKWLRNHLSEENELFEKVAKEADEEHKKNEQARLERMKQALLETAREVAAQKRAQVEARAEAQKRAQAEAEAAPQAEAAAAPAQ